MTVASPTLKAIAIAADASAQHDQAGLRRAQFDVVDRRRRRLQAPLDFVDARFRKHGQGRAALRITMTFMRRGNVPRLISCRQVGPDKFSMLLRAHKASRHDIQMTRQ